MPRELDIPEFPVLSFNRQAIKTIRGVLCFQHLVENKHRWGLVFGMEALRNILSCF